MYFDTTPLNIKDVPADSRHTSGGRRLDEIQYIVLHDTGSKRGEDIQDTLRWLSTHPNSNVSAHRTVGYDGQIYKHCNDTVIANTVGFSRMGNKSGLNRITLNIEIFRRVGDTSYPAVQIESTVYQCLEWIGKIGLKPILYHSQIDTQGKIDPRSFPRREFDMRLMELIARRLTA
jgi:N-acetyl-anhydromuramyl-L-alanine amidase AmpD